MKEKFIKSTIILIIGGLITKILGMLIRIITTRIIGVEGIGLYMLVMPTFSLFITIATLSLPVSISKLVAEDKNNNKRIILGITPIAMLLNIALILLIIILAPTIANKLLQNSNLYFPIIAIAITLPFITLSSIIRGYFFGKQKMIPHVLSNIVEQIIRIVSIVIITPLLLKKGINAAVTGLVLFNCLSEFVSIILMLLFMPKNIKIKKLDIKPDPSYIKDVFAISIPTTLGRLISSISTFFEPIILTFVFLKLGWSGNEITTEYGIITGYVLPMVMMPSFLTSAIANALLPVISKYYALNNNKQIKRKTIQAVIYSLIIGIPCTLLLFFFPDFCLKTIFNTTHGITYLKTASIIFLFSYVIGPFSSILQATNNSKKLMVSNLIGNIIKTCLLFLFAFFNMSMYAILFAYLIQYIYILIHQIILIKKVFN